MVLSGTNGTWQHIISHQLSRVVLRYHPGALSVLSHPTALRQKIITDRLYTSIEHSHRRPRVQALALSSSYYRVSYRAIVCHPGSTPSLLIDPSHLGIEVMATIPKTRATAPVHPALAKLFPLLAIIEKKKTGNPSFVNP